MFAAVSEDLFTERVLAHKARAIKWESGPGLGEVNEHVVRPAARALELAEDVAELFRPRIYVNELDLINDPVAASEEAATNAGGICFHGSEPILPPVNDKRAGQTSVFPREKETCNAR